LKEMETPLECELGSPRETEMELEYVWGSVKEMGPGLECGPGVGEGDWIGVGVGVRADMA
jgi:hypothetical protein